MPVEAPLAVVAGRGIVHARFTSRADGDLSADRLVPHEASRRWRALASCDVTWLDQRHTDVVVTVTHPAEHTGAVADGAVTDRAGLGVAVWVGDCAPVLLVADEGPFGVVHAGWRGLAAGVLHRGVEALRALGARDVRAWLGPCIHACCYEFADAELHRWAARLGPAVVGRTTWGAPALDVPAAVAASLAQVDTPLVDTSASCTGCDDRYWSFRRRGEMGRHGLVAWRAA